MNKKENATETELAILEVLWENGPVTVRKIVDEIYGEHRASLHATVKSLLDRLMDKGFVQKDSSQFAHEFSAAIEREAFVGQQLQKMVTNHFDGEIVPMLNALVDHTKLNRKEKEAIRQIIENLDD